jgi:hypothetical protein
MNYACTIKIYGFLYFEKQRDSFIELYVTHFQLSTKPCDSLLAVAVWFPLLQYIFTTAGPKQNDVSPKFNILEI